MPYPSISDRRYNSRLNEKLEILLKVPLRFETTEREFLAEAANINELGLTIYTKKVLPKISSFEFNAVLKKLTKISGTCQIIWRDDSRKVYGTSISKLFDNGGKILRDHIKSSLLEKSNPHERREKNNARRKASTSIDVDQRAIEDRRANIKLKKSNMFPRVNKDKDYLSSFVKKRRTWIESKTGTQLKHVTFFPEDSSKLSRNVENLIGSTSIPLGIAGPIRVRGRYANGLFYVPMATTQGTLVEAYHRGALLVTEAGGAEVAIYRDEIHLDPIFLFESLNESMRFITWVNDHQDEIKQKAEETTKYGILTRLTPFPIGNRVILNMGYSTGDAMGLNIINIASDNACRWIAEQVKPISYFLRSNFSSDKKASFFNFIAGYGKEVTAEIILPRNIISKFTRATPEDIYSFWYSALLGGINAGMIGMNAHFANGLSAIFNATGQDIAQIVNGSLGMLFLEFTKERDLKFTTKFPQLLLATVGGGTSLSGQKEALEIMGCAGEGKVKKFAEIVAAILLAGEISICGALASGEFAKADIALRKRNILFSTNDQ